MIYFVTAREIDRVKIGFSKNPINRFSKIQSDSPVKLVLEHVCEGGLLHEQALHKLFHIDRVYREWFKISDEIETYMENIIPLDPPSNNKFEMVDVTGMGKFQIELLRWLSDKKNTQATLAKAIGKSQPSLHRFARGERFPDAKTARLINECTEGKVPFSAWKHDYLARAGLQPKGEAT